jgi:anti-sigma factor ChrR (cupin superfamily)
MNRRFVLALIGSLVLAVAVGVGAAPGAEAKQDPRPTVIPADDLKWADLDPKGAPGVRIAPLWGDHQKGAFGAFLRLPAGFEAPLHTHTHEMKLVIVSGTYIQAPEGAPEFRLGPGSYFVQPGGNYRHTTRCDKAADCVFFFEGGGAFDMHAATSGKLSASTRWFLR